MALLILILLTQSWLHCHKALHCQYDATTGFIAGHDV
jgi:hypothetical protein